jgi:Periplasmic copper-binding protein (NosD)
MRAKPSVLVAVVCIAVLMLTLGVPTAAARGTTGPSTAGMGAHTIVVKPNGRDDTANLQAAFNTCTSHDWTCTIQLVKGTYYTDQIAVSGFQGSFVGAGQGATIVQGLANLPSPTADPFWAGLPGGGNPWPVLFTFVNGAFSISEMTVTDTYMYPTQGWDYPGIGTVTALWSWITITGTQAYVSIDHVTGIGAAGDQTIPVGTPDSFNSVTGINFEGMLLPSTWSNPYADQIPLAGMFVMTNSLLVWSESAAWVENLAHATVVMKANSIESTVENGFADVSNSQLFFVGNSFTNTILGSALLGFQSYDKTGLLPSTVYVDGNYISANWDGSGAYFFDYGVPSTLSAVIAGNTVVSDNSCGCYSWETSVVMGGESLSSLAVTGNKILGGGSGVDITTGPGTAVGNTVIGADVGVMLDGSIGATVLGNVIKNSGTWGIAVQTVLGTPINNHIIGNWISNSGAYDLYWDGTGTGNVWSGNVFGTSSPPGL